MLVGIDASRAVRPIRTGTEWYSVHLIAALLRRRSSYCYRLYLDRPPGDLFSRESDAEQRIIPLQLGWTHFRLSAEVVTRRPDLLFVPSHVIPAVCPVPAVVTIHDVGYLWHRSAYRPLAWLLLHLGTLWNARTGRIIIADSQATARDLTTYFGVAPERLRVAYLGGPPVEDVPPRPEILARYGLPPRYFLFVGTLQPRKNVARLIRAFAQVARQDGDVVLALGGQAGRGADALRGLIDRLGLGDRVRWLGYLPDADRPSLYAGAAAFVFPSLYEGFGMPVLEAMAWGAPVIASTTSSLPEVVGDAGLLVDPYDVDGLARAMAEVMTDPKLRERLLIAGRRRAATFSWDRCAGEVEAAFADALGTGVSAKGG